MSRKDVHVVPRGRGWAVRPSKADPTSTHRTQQSAIEAAKSLARWTRGEVVIHRPDGRIRDRDSYGNDPYPPVDRRH